MGGDPNPTPDALLTLGEGYRSIEYAGAGSMGAVYRAFDVELGSTVAIKTILHTTPDWVYRLKREFRSLRGVVHPNLVQLYDLVVGEEGCFFSMEFVAGPDFVEHVRGDSADPGLPELLDRFRAAAPQLVAGVRALHEAGHLHRDIKPTNIKVDPHGRVVLLDFDLVAPVEHRLPMDFASAEFAGTFAYMAPEQMLGAPSGPAADWYAVGCVLYESLTGTLPFRVDGLALSSPHQRELVPIRRWLPQLPGWLAQLVEALLAAHPDARPTGEEILDCIEGRSAPAAAARDRSAEPRVDLMGRDADLARLEAVRSRGGAAVVGVHGSSGVGKSEMIRSFLARAAAGGSGPVVLAGRCNPHEAVRFKSLDPIVDALSRHMIEMDTALPELDSHRAAALTKLFPVLARVPGIAAAAQGGDVPDALEARRLGAGALRRLLGALARADGLIIWIDDLQWSDLDSGNLLGEVLRPPYAPPLLVIVSYRTEDRGSIPVLSVLERMHAQLGELTLHEFALEPLDRAASTALTARLCSSRPLRPDQIEAIVSEAHGSPFLIQEMVRHVQSRAGGERIDLSNVVSERLGQLGPDERRILELVSLCGQPVERSLILRAAGVGARGRPLIARLEGRSLVRVQVSGGEHGVQAYHDRIREAISAELPAESCIEHHRGLAQVFESSGRVEPDLLAHHFHGARLLDRAADHAVAAADAAASGLAFERAAQLYRQAREWDPRSADWQRTLRTREAECTANASHLVEAGRTYLAAAADAPHPEALELRRLGTEHLLSGGSVEEGTAALESLLADLGLRYPRSARRALLGSLARLGRVFLRGEPRSGAPLDGAGAVRIDTCYGIGKSLVDMDSARGVYFSVLSLALALDSGDRYRMARSLGVVGGLLVLAGGPLAGRGRRMMERAREIAESIGAPELLGPLGVAEGQVLMLSGRWHEARERSSEAVRLMSEECRGFAFECNIGRGNVLRALEEIGEGIEEIAESAQQLYDAATSSANLYAETASVQHLSFVAMARGDLPRARELARRGVQLWNRDGFHVQHLYTARAVALCDLYGGTPTASYERLREIWSALRASNIMRVPLARIDAHTLRAQLALAMAHAGEGRREELLASCLAEVQRLEREPRDDARIHALVLRAGVHALRGSSAAALPLLERAEHLCETAGMPLRRACVRLRRGELLGGAEGRSCAADAAARIGAIGVSEPRAWAAMYALGFDGSARRAA